MRRRASRRSVLDGLGARMLGVMLEKLRAIAGLICYPKCVLDKREKGRRNKSGRYLIAPSNVPGRNPNPCPISCKNKSPSISRSRATSTHSAISPLSQYPGEKGTHRAC